MPVWGWPKCSISFSANSGVAHLGDAPAQAQAALRLPGQTLLDLRQHRVQACLQVPTEAILQGHGMDHDRAALAFLFATFGRRVRDERHALQHGVQAIVGSGHRPFGKDDQGPFGRLQNLCGRVDRLAVHALAIDAEAAHAADGPRGETTLVKKMPAGHGIHVAAGLAGQKPHDDRIAHAAVIGRQQDAMARPQ